MFDKKMEKIADSPFSFSSPFMIGDIQKTGWKIYFELIIWRLEDRGICKLHIGSSDQGVIDRVYQAI